MDISKIIIIALSALYGAFFVYILGIMIITVYRFFTKDRKELINKLVCDYIEQYKTHPDDNPLKDIKTEEEFIDLYNRVIYPNCDPVFGKWSEYNISQAKNDVLIKGEQLYEFIISDQYNKELAKEISENIHNKNTEIINMFNCYFIYAKYKFLIDEVDDSINNFTKAGIVGVIVASLLSCINW